MAIPSRGHLASYTFVMPLRDAARAACVCRAFLYSWRSFPNLTFSKQTLDLKAGGTRAETIRDFANRVDHIMKNHLGTGVKTLTLFGGPNSARHQRRLDSWLEKAVTPGIEEVTICLDEQFTAKKYMFPCSILSHGNGDSIRRFNLAHCAFRPTIGFGCLRSLARVHLFFVHIEGDELGCFLSNSLALEFLCLDNCFKLVYAKIPSLQRLNYLSVISCCKLKVIESKAPNLSSFHFESDHHVQVSLGKALQVKKLHINCWLCLCQWC
ncbi:uncharacterized protein LOC8078801 [Sorghum bicolor]|uniref:uncharacterized protein LOC8078801 n=1 Tax=Sorghum bicolor TaxID=4558 RepID=UPI0001A84594|nr:uncharacterized protein LOC8078801 [Sorghum bicolor]|eukprot:XP_002455094.1 uncharacterized protein LOC8078801 [Sorghum bicolor]